MPFSLAERLESLIEEVTKVELESEGTYLSLGRLFPSLVSEMKRSSKNASASLDGFSDFVGGTVDGGLRRMEAFARDSGAFFRSVHGRDVEFLARINESIDRLSTLEGVIGRVRLDSEEMEIISLNAMTVALKSGNAGKAFSVITDELKGLSTRTIALTETITGRGRDLMQCFSGLRDSLRELDEFQKGFYESIDRALTQGYAGLEEDIRQASSLFSGLLEEARGVQSPVQAIMQGIQLQDIIRQSLQHVTISLTEARTAAVDAESDSSTGAEEGVDRGEQMAFVSAIADLANSLLDDIVGQLTTGADTFEGHIGQVSGIVEDVEARRREFVAGVASHKADAGRASGNFMQGSARYLGLKKQVIQTARRLAEQVKQLDESFRGLAGLLSRFQNIVVASRIEVAKNRALAGVSNTVQGMIQLTDSIGADVGEAMDTTKGFIKLAYNAIVEYAGTDEGGRLAVAGRWEEKAASGKEKETGTESLSESDRLQGTLRHLEDDLKLLDSSRNRVEEAIGNFLLYTPEFISLIAEAHTALSVLRDFAARIHAYQSELASLRAGIGPVGSAGGGAEGLRGSIKSERLRAMIERFTIFTHKKTASEIGQFDVEDGVEAGEVTLF